MSYHPFIDKLLDTAIEHIQERTERHLKDRISSGPTYERAYKNPMPPETKWKVTWTLSIVRRKLMRDNAWIFQRISIKDTPFDEIFGFFVAVTINNQLFIPTSMEYGSVVEGSIPAGIFMIHGGWGDRMISTLPNRSSHTPKVNPFGELIRFETDIDRRGSRSKITNHMDRLTKKESWSGVVGFAGKTMKYEFSTPRVLTAVPWGKRTIVSVRSGVRYDGDKRYKYPWGQREFDAKVVRPWMQDIDHHLSILSHLHYLINHVNHDTETYGEFPTAEIVLPRLIALELRRKEIEGSS